MKIPAFVSLAVIAAVAGVQGQTETVVHRKIVPPPSGESATGLIRAAMAEVAGAMQSSGAEKGEVVLAEGEYVLEAVPGDEDYLIAIHGISGLTLRGEGPKTRLLVRDVAPNGKGFFRKVIAAYGAKDFSVETLTIDMVPEARNWVQGVARNVESKGDSEVSFVLELDAYSPPFRPEIFSRDRCFLLGVVQDDNGRPREGFPDYFEGSNLRRLSEKTLEVSTRVEGFDPQAFLDNQRVVIACRKPGEALFCFVGAVRPRLSDLRIHASRGLMIEAYGCDRLELDRVKMEPAKGQWLISPGDGLHYQGGISGPFVHDSHFEGLADDAMNIYTKSFPLTPEGVGVYQCEGAAISVGDHLWVYGAGNAEAGRMITVTKAEAGRFWAEGGEPSEIVNRGINLSRSGQNFEVRRNTFGPLRGLGCRLQTGPGVVEGNRFEQLSGAPVSLECGLQGSYDEGPFPFDISITGNRFAHSAGSAGYDRSGVRRVAPWDPAVPQAKAFRDITVRGNTVENMKEANF